MKADAPRSAEQEALEWAVNKFRWWRDLLTPEGSRQKWHAIQDSRIPSAYEYLMKLGRPEKALELLTFFVVRACEGDGESIRELRILAAALIERGETLPDELRDFIVEYLREPKPEKKRTPGPARYMEPRDLQIFSTIFQIVDKWKIPATRNPATTGSSAASIVRDALEVAADVKLTEDAINKIWKAFSKGVREAIARRHRRPSYRRKR
jgi:hypothetical protein